jgi:hypothetical protein
MKPAAWIVVAVAAMIASVAWRFARRSKLALAIAVVGTSLAAFGLAFAAGGWGGCHDRGDCGPVGGTLRTILSLETLLLPLLLLAAAVRALWRRFVPKRKPREKRSRTRMRPRDIALAVGGVVFLLLSLLFLATARGEDRIAAVAVLLFSVAILLVPIAGVVAARSGARPQLARVDGQPALVIEGSNAKMLLMRVACLCFGGMGLLMAIWPHALAGNGRSPTSVQVVGIACAAFFGLGGIASMLLARGPSSIELLPTGLRWRAGAKPSFVKWDAITGVHAFSIRNTWFVGIDGDVEIPRGQRWLAGANRAIAHADASISLEAFPVEPDQLAEVIAMCAQDEPRRREIGTEASLRWFEDGVPAPPEPAPAGVS